MNITVNNLNNEIISKLEEIEEKTSKAIRMMESGDSENLIEELFWDSDELLKKQEYFHFNSKTLIYLENAINKYKINKNESQY